MATATNVLDWLDKDFRFAEQGCVEVTRNHYDPAKKEEVLRFNIYTEVNRYSISAIIKDGCNDGYLGCTASCRKPRAGETWGRGRDLSDGPFSEETWRKILSDIVSYELVKVHSCDGNFIRG